MPHCEASVSVGAPFSAMVQRKGENVMKIPIATFAVTLALAFSGPVFAGDVTAAKTYADCVKAGGMWDAKTNTCLEKKGY
jgi:hypothetical protein